MVFRAQGRAGFKIGSGGRGCQGEKRAMKKEKSSSGLFVSNAGTDVLIGNPLEEMKITSEGIATRHEGVFRSATDRKIPILMVLSGGYTKKSAGVIRRES
jgi:acetoin utilization deacetylase AcuC-like enzyme